VGGEGECDLKATCNITSPISTLNRRLMDFYAGLSVGELLKLSKKTSPEASA
jgi:hypothetical protein